jgi:hypothetical protein
MNVSIEGGRAPDGARRGLSLSSDGGTASGWAGPPEEPDQHGWRAGVEAVAARWQAALGGFHRTGAPPSR